MNKGREGKGAAPSTDLLVCFPSRTHLRLMPKAICSPVRPLEPNKLHHHQRKRSISKAGGGGQASSPMLWTKNKSAGSENSEPTSPKVTCAGQIKVRHKNTASRSWQSVMEEIEKIHNKKQKKRLNWAESLGFKKEIMHFFTCLRAVRFDFRCFGSFSGSDIVTEDDEEEDDDGEDEDEDKDEVYYKNDHVGVDESHDNNDHNESSRAVFSKWFMVLQEDQNNEVHKEEEKKEEIGDGDEDGDGENPVPPPNALLLMRCRSAPAKSWLTESEEEVHGNNNEKENISHKEKEKVIEKELSQTHVKKGQSLKSMMEEEKINKKENLLVMRYNPEFYGISTDVAAETWIVGGLPDPMSRSRSWKR